MSAFDPTGFLEVARALAEPTDAWPLEASARSSVSRAYYAAHLLAVDALRRKRPGWSPTGKGDDHGRVIRELALGKTRRIAERLTDLRKRREHADYHVDPIADECSFCRDYLDGRRSALVEIEDALEAVDLAARCADALRAL